MLNKKRLRKNKISNNISFLTKFYGILNDEQYKDIIHWNNDGKIISIKNVNKLCEIVLPNFYKHANYSSFLRQLNLYGFYKKKGALKKEIYFEHYNLNRNSTEEQIKEIGQHKRIMKNIIICDKYNNMEEKIVNSSDKENLPNKYYIFKYLFDKIEENESNILEFKKIIENYKNINKNLFDKLQFMKVKLYGHSIFLQKIINYKNYNRINEVKKLNITSINKSKNIKDLLKKYLYYLHIYSPYIIIKGNRIEKVHSFKINSINKS